MRFPSRTSEEALSQNFVLVVHHQETGRDYSLNFPGDRTIQEVRMRSALGRSSSGVWREAAPLMSGRCGCPCGVWFPHQVKRNISDVTNIPVRQQQWEGWPVTATDEQVRAGKGRYSHSHRKTPAGIKPRPAAHAWGGWFDCCWFHLHLFTRNWHFTAQLDQRHSTLLRWV